MTNDVVWVALISAGGAIAVALMTQYLAMSAARKQADRADKTAALQWQRTEAIRLEALAHDAMQTAQARALAEAQRLRALHESQLQALWGYVLAARWQMLDALARVPVQGSPTPATAEVSAALLPANAAGQAYAAALLDLAAVRPAAKAFYLATSKLQLAMQACDQGAMLSGVSEWTESYLALEQSVSALADSWHHQGKQVTAQAASFAAQPKPANGGE